MWNRTKTSCLFDVALIGRDIVYLAHLRPCIELCSACADIRRINVVTIPTNAKYFGNSKSLVLVNACRLHLSVLQFVWQQQSGGTRDRHYRNHHQYILIFMFFCLVFVFKNLTFQYHFVITARFTILLLLLFIIISRFYGNIMNSAHRNAILFPPEILRGNNKFKKKNRFDSQTGTSNTVNR